MPAENGADVTTYDPLAPLLTNLTNAAITASRDPGNEANRTWVGEAALAIYTRFGVLEEQLKQAHAERDTAVAAERERIARAITDNVRNPDFAKQDRGGFVGFTECMAYVAGHDKAAAIACGGRDSGDDA